MSPGWAPGRSIFVTGGTGFLGSHLVRRLLADGGRVHALTSSVSSNVPERLADVIDDLHLVEGNINDPSSLDFVVNETNPDVVIHLAAFTHVGKSFHRVDENIQTNIQGTVNLLSALRGNYERFVYVGTGEVYGDAPVPYREDGPVQPLSPYAVSKYAAERYCRMFQQAYGWPIVCVRPFNTYGPWQTPDRIIPELVLSALEKKPLEMTGGEQIREFTYVEDMIDAFVRALTVTGLEGSVINLGSTEEISMRALALTVLDLLGNPVEPLFGALPYRPNEIWRMVGDSTRSRELLDWRPHHDLAAGLEKTIDWYRSTYRRRD